MYTLDQLKKKLEACEARLTVIDVPADEIEEGLVLKIKELDGNTMDVWQNYYNDHLEDKIDISKTGSPTSASPISSLPPPKCPTTRTSSLR